MAPPIVRNKKGQAIWEALPVLGVLATLLSGLILIAYLIFIRAWLDYHAEKSLYCLITWQNPTRCSREFYRQVQKFMPFGKVEQLHLSGKFNQAEIQLTWQWKGHRVRLQRRLNERHLLDRKRVLRW